MFGEGIVKKICPKCMILGSLLLTSELAVFCNGLFLIFVLGKRLVFVVAFESTHF